MTSNEFENTIAYYEGEFDIHSAKCLSSLVRYSRPQITAILSLAPTASLMNFGKENNIPVISKVDEIPVSTQRLMLATLHNAEDTLPILVNLIKECIKKRIHVYNGDHLFLKPMFSEPEQAYVHDLRAAPANLKLFSGNLMERSDQLRILIVGLDCNIGKMTVSLELERFLSKEGFDAEFIATGQISMMIKGKGIPLDRTIVDFTSGTMEEYLIKHHNQILVIEGQGSIFAPMYSGLTLAQVHGSVPQFMILCVDPSRDHPRYFPQLKLPTIDQAILQYEHLAAHLISTSRIMGISANTSTMNEGKTLDYISGLEKRHKLPVTDPIRFGCDKFKKPIENWISDNC
ncbi:MAG: DUF1611 domain-containing protein [Candidatus Anammoxibacter sp.]